MSKSFGGFLRGQALMGFVYFLVALVTSVLFGLPLVGITAAAAGILMAIPFFGPFVSWMPPVDRRAGLQAGRGPAGHGADGASAGSWS